MLLKKNLTKLRDMGSEMLELSRSLELSTYTLERDDKANLYITFADGHVEKLPYIPFRIYQEEVAIKLFIENIKRFLLERPRRSGKEVESWNILIEAAVESPGLYLMVYPTNVRAKGVLWDGAILMPDGRSIKFLDMIPPRLVQNINNQEMKVKLVNGSVIWVLGSDIDPNKLRGTNPRGIVYAEFAFQDPRVFHIMLPALRQNGGWLLGQSTFDGMNHFYQLIENNKNDPLWYCRVDSIVNLVDENGNRYITDEMIEEDRRAGMPEYLIQQEYYGVVQINQETKYFAHAIKNIFDFDHRIPGLLIPNGNVYTAWDIGMNDCTAIIIFQVKRVDNFLKPIIIGYFENNNRDLPFYVMEIRRFCNRYHLPFKDHFIPHDGQKRDFNTGKNSLDFMRDMGESAFIVPKPASKENAIEAMRQKLYLCDFNKENTTRLIDCLSNYSKEFDDKLGTYKNKPIHNWASHGVDAFQTMTLALDGGMISDKAYDVVYYMN
jgi:phage terminase large subunit